MIWWYIYYWTFLIFMLMLMLDLWLQAETPGVSHFGAYHRPPDGHFLSVCTSSLQYFQSWTFKSSKNHVCPTYRWKAERGWHQMTMTKTNTKTNTMTHEFKDINGDDLVTTWWPGTQVCSPRGREFSRSTQNVFKRFPAERNVFGRAGYTVFWTT